MVYVLLYFDANKHLSDKKKMYTVFLFFIRQMTTSHGKNAELMEERTKGEMRLKQHRRAITTKLDTDESAIFREWQQMEEKAKALIDPPQQTREELSSQMLQSSPRRQKPKAVKRPHSRFFAGLRR